MTNFWLYQLKTVARALKKQLRTTALNLSMLLIGFVVSIYIASFLIYEHNYDTWIHEYDKTFALEAKKNIPGKPTRDVYSAPAVLVPFIRDKMDDVLYTAMAFDRYLNFFDGNLKATMKSYFVNQDFISLFKMEPLAGTFIGFAKKSNVIALSKSQSERLFGTQNSVGKILKTNDANTFKVVAVYNDWPKHSHMQVPSIMPLNSTAFDDRNAYLSNWGSTGGRLFLQFKHSMNPVTAEHQLNELLKTYAPPHYGRQISKNTLPFYQIKLRKIHQITTQRGSQWLFLGFSMEHMGLIAIAAIILMICLVNYTLSFTSQIIQRQREIVFRKLFGARVHQIVSLIYIESFFIILITMLIALFGVFILLPFAPKTLAFDFIFVMQAPFFYQLTLLLIVISVISTALYPTFKVADHNSVNELLTEHRTKTISLLDAFVIGQIFFVMLTVFMAMVLFQQYRFVDTIDRGFDSKGVYILPLETGYNAQFSALLKELNKELVIGALNTFPGSGVSNSVSVSSRNNQNSLNFDWFNSDANGLVALNARVLAGRLFLSRSGEDAAVITQGNIPVVINRAASNVLGFSSPELAVGHIFQHHYSSSNKTGSQNTAEIIGVIEDFKVHSMDTLPSPTMIINDTGKFQHLVFKAEREGVNRVKALFAMHYPNKSWRFIELHNHLMSYFEKSKSQIQLTMVAAIISVFLAGFGMLAYLNYAMSQRLSSLMIQQIYGATQNQALKKLVTVLYIPTIVAVILSIPSNMYLCSLWLEKFTYRYSNVYLPYFVSLATLLILCCLIIIILKVKLTKMTPIEVLKGS